MLGIVERILAALIILALLTLLIILAFPVPPRPSVGVPPGETRTEKTPDPAPPTPTPAPAPTKQATRQPEPAPTPASAPAPAVRKSSERLPETAPPPAAVEPKAPQPTVLAKSNKERIVDSRIEEYPQRRIATVRREPVVVARRDRVRHAPVLADDCPFDCVDGCCCDTRNRPYWAKPKRRVVADGRPYWTDRPPARRPRYAAIPPGVCPD